HRNRSVAGVLELDLARVVSLPVSAQIDRRERRLVRAVKEKIVDRLWLSGDIELRVEIPGGLQVLRHQSEGLADGRIIDIDRREAGIGILVPGKGLPLRRQELIHRRVARIVRYLLYLLGAEKQPFLHAQGRSECERAAAMW